MPTHGPVADAAETREVLRARAHASRSFDDPAHTYKDHQSPTPDQAPLAPFGDGDRFAHRALSERRGLVL